MQSPAINSALEVLKRLDPETQAEYADAIEELLETRGWAVFCELLDATIESKRFIIEGWVGIHPYEQITSQQGFFRGLLSARAIPDAVRVAGERATQELRQTAAQLEATR